MEKFNISAVGSTLKIVLQGRFEDSDINDYGKAYMAAVQKINPAQTTLELDVKGMGTITPEKQEGLKNFFMIYKKTGFKKIIMIMESNAILAMQTKRLAKEIGILDFEIR